MRSPRTICAIMPEPAVPAFRDAGATAPAGRGRSAGADWRSAGAERCSGAAGCCGAPSQESTASSRLIARCTESSAAATRASGRPPEFSQRAIWLMLPDRLPVRRRSPASSAMSAAGADTDGLGLARATPARNLWMVTPLLAARVLRASYSASVKRIRTWWLRPLTRCRRVLPFDAAGAGRRVRSGCSVTRSSPLPRMSTFSRLPRHCPPGHAVQAAKFDQISDRIPCSAEGRDPPLAPTEGARCGSVVAPGWSAVPHRDDLSLVGPLR